MKDGEGTQSEVSIAQKHSFEQEKKRIEGGFVCFFVLFLKAGFIYGPILSLSYLWASRIF